MLDPYPQHFSKWKYRCLIIFCGVDRAMTEAGEGVEVKEHLLKGVNSGLEVAGQSVRGVDGIGEGHLSKSGKFP
jgi:hypothetical protein